MFNSSKCKASGPKKSKFGYNFDKILIFDKFSRNSSQKNSDRKNQQPSSTFRDTIINTTVNNFITFQQNLVKKTENVSKKRAVTRLMFTKL